MDLEIHLLIVTNNYFFFNPKAGITYTQNKIQAYISFGRSSKEPNRDDFESGVTTMPKPEILNDVEMGIEKKNINNSWGINLYYMFYRNQLVLTGKINDVGAYTRTNIPSSYRAGIELQGSNTFNKWISVNGNISFSENKIRNFTEYIDDYDNGGQQTKFYKKTDISFSPAVVSSLSFNVFPLKNIEVNFISKYVSRQYLDNTAQNNRSLNAYFTEDARIAYSIKSKQYKAIGIFAQVNNIFSEKYEPNGYSFSYIYGGSTTTENFYFPMATVNFMIGVNIKL